MVGDHCGVTARARAPSAAVRSAFVCLERPVLLPGGEGQSWRCGDVVLKPATDRDQAAWIADVLSRVSVDGLVVPEPVRGATGEWVVDGWTAARWVDAQPRDGAWHDVMRAGRAFHGALAAVPRPAWMDRADDWWRRADRVAWESRRASGALELVALVARLRVLLSPVALPEQVVHADLCGNVLFDARDRPVVLDFSPYWRPREWASAVVAVDAYEWEGAGAEALDWLRDVRDGDQLLLRAAIFRIATSAETVIVRGDAARKVDVHTRTVEQLEARFRA